MLTDAESVLWNTSEFATTVTYGTTSITAQVIYGDAEEVGEERQDFKVDKARISVKVSDITTPAYRDEITIGSDTWYVQRIISGDEVEWLLGIEKDERPDLR